MRAVLAHKPGPIYTGKIELSPASLYFRFYVARAMDHAGLADLYLDSLRALAQDDGDRPHHLGGD